jgi:hypothetical protein
VMQGKSAPGICNLSGYNYIEVHVVCSLLAAGSVTIRVNGLTAYSVSGVRTQGYFIGSAFVDGVELVGSNTSTVRHDDFYIVDPSAGPNNSFLGAVRIYACLPFADSAPLQWSASIGTAHFPLVNSVPPDLSKWVQSNVVGQQDQYRHDTSAIPTTVNILGVQHCLESLLDAPGSRSVASVVNGIVAGSAGSLSTSARQYMQEYDLDPVTGLPWLLADLAASRQFGPAVTA